MYKSIRFASNVFGVLGGIELTYPFSFTGRLLCGFQIGVVMVTRHFSALSGNGMIVFKTDMWYDSNLFIFGEDSLGISSL